MRWIVGCMIALSVFASCESGNPNSESEGITPEQQAVQDSIAEREAILEEKKKVIEEEAKKKQEEAQKYREENPVDLTSIYTYLKTNPDYVYTSKLLFKSDYRKTLHNEQLTFLACPDEILLKKHSERDLMALTKPENKKKLEKFIGDHIIDRRLSAHKIQKAEEVVTITGRKLNVSEAEKPLTINGVKAEIHDYVVDNGFIIKMEDVIDFPK